MAVPVLDALIRIEGIQAINGPASMNAVLLDGVNTANFEGLWVPWLYVKQGSLEVSGTFTGLSCQLYGTNAIAPVNSYTVTISGSVSAGTDVTNLQFNFAGLSQISVSYATIGGDTTTTIAAGLAAAVNASLTLAQLGVRASSTTTVITITWPSPLASPAPGAFASTASPQVSPVLFLTGSNSPGSEVYTVAPGAGGSTLGAATTTAGMTQFSLSARWLKIRITALTSGSVTAIAQGTA